MADVRELVEAAFQTYLDGELTATVLTGTDDADKELPCVIVNAGAYTEEFVGSAVYRVELNVKVKSAVDDLTDHNTLVDAVRTAMRLSGSELAAALTSATLRVYGWGAPDRHETEAEDDAYTDTLFCEVFASPL